MVQVQPVVFRKFAANNLFVVDDGVRNFGVSERHGHGIVPWQLVLWRIDGDFWCFLEFQSIHVHVFAANLAQYSGRLGIGQDFETDITDNALCFNRFAVWYQETSAAVVEQPLSTDLILEHPICYSVCLQMIGLCFIHRNEQTERQSLGAKHRGNADYQYFPKANHISLKRHIVGR